MRKQKKRAQQAKQRPKVVLPQPYTSPDTNFKNHR